MTLKKKIAQVSFSILLTVALMLPIGVQAIHALDGHEHVACKEIKTHLHEEKLSCDICDFQMSGFDYPTLEFIAFTSYEVSEELIFSYDRYFHTEDTGFNSLRGPPALS